MNDTEMVLASNKMHIFHLQPTALFFSGATFISDSRSFWRGDAFWFIRTLMAKLCHVWLLFARLGTQCGTSSWNATDPTSVEAQRKAKQGRREHGSQEHHWMLGGTWMLMGKMRCGSCVMSPLSSTVRPDFRHVQPLLRSPGPNL